MKAGSPRPSSLSRFGRPVAAEVLPKSAARSAGSALDESMRSKFVGILMRIAARTGKAGPIASLDQLGVGAMRGVFFRCRCQACFDACSRVERALFEKCGKDPKEYRQRARSHLAEEHLLSHCRGFFSGWAGVVLDPEFERVLVACQLLFKASCSPQSGHSRQSCQSLQAPSPPCPPCFHWAYSPSLRAPLTLVPRRLLPRPEPQLGLQRREAAPPGETDVGRARFPAGRTGALRMLVFGFDSNKIQL